MTKVAPPPRRRLPLRRRIAFALVPLLAILLLAELAIRIGRAPLHFGSFRELRTDLLKRNYPAALDDRLGYVPRAGFESRDNHWGTLVSIDADGLRRNGTEPPAGRPVVAVGDSFTFGDQVDDAESWPAQLERELGQPVKNGGVFGYSFAQAVLRGEDLVRRFRPAALVVSLIPDDLQRCAFRYRYTAVPWFDLVDGELVLRGVPIDHSAASPGDPDKAFKDLLGHSALLDVLFASTARQWWFESEKQVPVPHLWGRTAEIGRKLVERVAATCREHDTRLLLVLQGDRPHDDASSVLRHAEQLGVPTLDLVARFAERVAAEPSLRTGWFDGHMTAAGNAWVATEVAAALRKLPALR